MSISVTTLENLVETYLVNLDDAHVINSFRMILSIMKKIVIENNEIRKELDCTKQELQQIKVKLELCVKCCNSPCCCDIICNKCCEISCICTINNNTFQSDCNKCLCNPCLCCNICNLNPCTCDNHDNICCKCFCIPCSCETESCTDICISCNNYICICPKDNCEVPACFSTDENSHFCPLLCLVCGLNPCACSVTCLDCLTAPCSCKKITISNLQ